MVNSSGIILYRFNKSGEIEFFMAHPGGPYGVNGFWAFPKGKVEENDKVYITPSEIPFMSTTTWNSKENTLNEMKTLLNGGLREFEEETAIPIESYVKTSRYCKLDYLGKIKQSTKKYVHAFSVRYQEQWNIDITKCYSNTCEIEWPRKSGKIIEIPENDKYSWMTWQEVQEKTNPKHLIFYKQILTKNE